MEIDGMASAQEIQVAETVRNSTLTISNMDGDAATFS